MSAHAGSDVASKWSVACAVAMQIVYIGLMMDSMMMTLSQHSDSTSSKVIDLVGQR